MFVQRGAERITLRLNLPGRCGRATCCIRSCSPAVAGAIPSTAIRAAVLEDLLDEKIDCHRARSIYGVALAADGLSVDFDATRSLRAQRRTAAPR